MALTTNVARDPEWDLKESTTNVAQRTRKEPRKSQPRTWHREPERNPGRISHERGTENQKGTPEE
jgi:hypothetical protein